MSKAAVLRVQISTGDARPIFKQIVDGVRMQIAQGDLVVGTKLPSVRGLATQLMINPNTVAKAYNELTNQGLAESRQGLGLFVAPVRQRLNASEQQAQLEQAIAAFVNEVAYLDYDNSEVLDAVGDALAKLGPGEKLKGN